jgi:MinD-like ATPase involved in chromosome partitioning or flagellar assembly
MAHSPRSWARSLKQHVIDHGGGRIMASIMSAEDAFVDGYDVFIADDTTSFLSLRFVADLQRRGIAVVGVYDPAEAEGSGRQRLLDLRVDAVVEANSAPTPFLRVLGRASSKSTGLQRDALATLVADMAGPTVEHHSAYDVDGRRSHRGRLIVVTGASGGVGATEVAIGLTTILVDRGDNAVLVDADDVGPSIVQRLGMDVHPNLRTAIDLIRNSNGNLDDVLIDAPLGSFKVLGGLAHRRDWFELRPGDVAETVLELARTRDNAIVNVSSRLEDLPAMGGPARYGVTRSLIALADVVVLVGNPTPIGVARVLDWVAEAKLLIEATPLFVAFNAYRGGAFKAAEIEGELRRVYQPGAIGFIPHDKGLVHATWQGLLPGRGPFVKSLERMATWLVSPRGSAPKHRKER